MGISVKSRVKQMEGWLNDNYPTPYPVIIRWSHKVAAGRDERAATRRSGYYGECAFSKPNIVIRVSSKLNRHMHVALETTMHEWAHAVTMPNDRVWKKLEKVGAIQHHPDEFWLVFGRIYRQWHDEGGQAESRKYVV